MRLTFKERMDRAMARFPHLRPRVEALMREEAVLSEAMRSRGRAKGGGQSSKAKGRGAVQAVKALLHEAFPELADDDLLVKATSMGGVDLHLSPRAAACFPWGIEAKCVEALNIWGALKQAELNADRKTLPPIVFFKRAHSEMFVALRASDFLQLYAQKEP
jgi:hypothetical protein